MHKIALFCVALVLALMFWWMSAPRACADGVKVGDRARNMKILPAWEMRQCPTLFYATYDLATAQTLKEKDAECFIHTTRNKVKAKQLDDYRLLVTKYKEQAAVDAELKRLDAARVSGLLKQVKQEVAEKNKYKYKPDYKWVWIAVGCATAAVGVAFGAGVWAVKR